MAARWNRRRLATTLLLTGVLGLLYLQSRQHGSGSGSGSGLSLGSSWGNVLPPGARPPPAPPAAPAPPTEPGAPGTAGLPQNPAVAPGGEGPGRVPPPPLPVVPPKSEADNTFHWAQVPLHHAVASSAMRAVPTASSEALGRLPRIQHAFGGRESAAARTVRLARRELVRANFSHAWNGYKTHAWMADEVRPVKGTPVSRFGGWAATLVDALDTLWIMGLHAEFQNAVNAVEQIDFSTTNLDEVNVFETTIRYLGGLLAAYDVSDGQYPSLLLKARELGDMLYVAFDTPNHVPVTRWKMAEARRGRAQTPHKTSLVSELGSLSLEFTRLSQLTGDAKYYDAVQRLMDRFAAQQDRTHLPGLWPVVVNAETADFAGSTAFTIGGMADSLYEYLPKQFLLLGGAVPSYRDMYLKALDAMKRHLFFRPHAPSARPMLFPGDKNTNGRVPPEEVATVPRVQHLGCFAGGMVGLASRLFDRPEDMAVAQQLVEGCLWAYETAPAGIMPEIMTVGVCPEAAAGTKAAPCAFREADWLAEVVRRHKTAPNADKPAAADAATAAAQIVAAQRLVPGVVRYDDRRYILRPEAIESVFVLYRLTGDAALLDRGWALFEAIVRATETPLAHTAVADSTAPRATWADSMESFWLAETLKYFYLLYEEPQVISLDTYVLNTEAHPLRRPG